MIDLIICCVKIINILFIDKIVLYQWYYRNQWVRHCKMVYYIIIMSEKLHEMPLTKDVGRIQ